MRVPSATYRVQFNKEFRFADALALVPQLDRLGITHLYASPVFAARPGSQHGYDVTDPNKLNPELGTTDEFDALVAALQERGMGLVLDIVPNHMAASQDNAWWMDVLENGAASRFAAYFGIRWDAARENVEEKIFLPILGGPYGEVLESGDLKVSYEDGGLYVKYFEHRLPVAPVTYAIVLNPGCEPLMEDSEFRALKEMIDRLPPRIATDWDALERRDTEKENIKTRIAQLRETSAAFREHLDRSIECLNGQPGNPESFDVLHQLLDNQAYRLAYWRVAKDRINYRRFFDVSDLIGMRVENEEVFNASHALVLSLVRDGKVDGLRIDHIDGLNDPLGYLQRLPTGQVYTVAEKILEGTERLPEDWPIQGTSGYDFLGYMNAMFVHPDGLERLTWFYRDVIGFPDSLEDVAYDRKRLAMRSLFPGEMADLGASLGLLAEEDRYARDFSSRDITRALREITAALHVYRTYIRDQNVSERDREYIQQAKSSAAERSAAFIEAGVFDFAERVLTLRFSRSLPEEQRGVWLRLVRRWQQITGPVMAKGVEDSTFYVYNRLVSMNEVGGVPCPVGSEEAHEFLSHRASHWPLAMNASSTHDTKRSEDVRARLNILSEIPDEWIRHVTRWRRLMRDRRGAVDDNEEYFVYQNLLGAWPLDSAEVPEYRERFRNYLVKAAREARVHTDWLRPSEEHESALTAFADVLFDDERFQASFLPFFEKVAWYGAINSLSQLMLKATAPGIPDFYRGTIGWDFSLVDPDNRRPVQFAPLTDFSEEAKNLFTHWRDGRVKIYLTEKLLGFRKGHPELFERGDYVPVATAGKRAGNVFAFMRSAGDDRILVVIPRFVAQISTAVRPPLGQRVWQDTVIHLPEGAPARWRNKITGESVPASGGQLHLHRILSHFPVALLSASR